MNDKIELPPLPEPTIEGSVMHPELKICYRAPVHFTADHMKAYGKACIEADRAARTVADAPAECFGMLTECPTCKNEIGKCVAVSRAAAPVEQAARTASAVPEVARNGYVLALQTAVKMPNGKNELGYTLLSGIGIFTSEQEVHEAIAELSLPLGWVSMTTQQLLPGWMLPPTPPAHEASARDAALESLIARLEMVPHAKTEHGELARELRALRSQPTKGEGQ